MKKENIKNTTQFDTDILKKYTFIYIKEKSYISKINSFEYMFNKPHNESDTIIVDYNYILMDNYNQLGFISISALKKFISDRRNWKIKSIID